MGVVGGGFFFYCVPETIVWKSKSSPDFYALHKWRLETLKNLREFPLVNFMFFQKFDLDDFATFFWLIYKFLCGCQKFFRTLTIIITYDYNYFYSQTFQTRMLTTRNKKNETITKRKKHWHRWKIEVYVPKFFKDFFFENLKIVWKHFPKKFKYAYLVLSLASH